VVQAAGRQATGREWTKSASPAAQNAGAARRKLSFKDKHALEALPDKLFVEHARETTRGWKQTAAVLGLDDSLNVKPNGLADRWGDHDVRPGEIAALEAEIARLQTVMSDPKLFARDRVTFDTDSG
jgi:hypothetical protein